MTKPSNNRLAKQKALISAATTLFARRGYEATTTREIAARAGCAEGLIHRYFGGKSGLLFNIVKVHLAQDAATTIECPASATLDAEIQKLMDWQLDHLWKEREFLCLAFSCGILQARLGNLLRKYMPHGRHWLLSGSALYQPGCSNEDIEMFAHALISLGFEFGFMRPSISDRTGGKPNILPAGWPACWAAASGPAPAEPFADTVASGFRRSKLAISSLPEGNRASFLL